MYLLKNKAELFLARECGCYPHALIFHPLRDPQINETSRKKKSASANSFNATTVSQTRSLNGVQQVTVLDNKKYPQS